MVAWRGVVPQEWWFATMPDLQLWSLLIALGPVSCLGGALLGVVTGRWLRFPGAPALVVLATLVVCVLSMYPAEEGRAVLRLVVPWAPFHSGTNADGTTTLYGGNASFYLLYLLCLCLAGALVAMWHDRSARTPRLRGAIAAVTVVGLLCLGLAMTTGHHGQPGLGADPGQGGGLSAVRWWYLRRGVPWASVAGCCAAVLVLSGWAARWPSVAPVVLPLGLAAAAAAAAFLLDEVAAAVVEVTPRGDGWWSLSRYAGSCSRWGCGGARCCGCPRRHEGTSRAGCSPVRRRACWRWGRRRSRPCRCRSTGRRAGHRDRAGHRRPAGPRPAARPHRAVPLPRRGPWVGWFWVAAGLVGLGLRQ